MNIDLRFFIKRPDAKRKKFELVAYTLKDKVRGYEKLAEELKAQVDKINEQFLTKILTQEEADALLLDLIQTQYRKMNVRDMVLKNSKLSKINQKVFNNFWNKVYGNKELVDEESARYDFLKAIRIIDPLSLATAEAPELRKKLKQNTSKTAEVRRAIDRLNQIFKFLGRDLRLYKPEEDIRIIRHITEADLDALLNHIEDAVMRDLVITLFCSGLRISESMALQETDLINNTFMVMKQFTRHKELKRPKRGRTGKVAIIPFGLAAAKRWVSVQNKTEYRYSITNALTNACRKAFPTSRNKWISPHDLRHSHAIYLLGTGASLTAVSMNLRNRIEVCQKYYTGFSHSDDTIDTLKKLFELKSGAVPDKE